MVLVFFQFLKSRGCLFVPHGSCVSFHFLLFTNRLPTSVFVYLLAGKRVRFKPTTTEATSEQVLEAMAKIASHIGNPGKFPKASKLALQLLESGSVTPATADSFFSILKAAMARPSNAVEASLRRDYQALFVAVHDRLEVFSG